MSEKLEDLIKEWTENSDIETLINEWCGDDKP